MGTRTKCLAFAGLILFFSMLESRPSFASFRRNLGGPTATPTSIRPAASVFNPGAINGISGTQIQTDVGIIGGYFLFERSGTNSGGAPHKPVVFTDIMPLPFISFKSDFGTRVFGAGINAYIPIGNTANFPEEGAQRYSVISGSFIPVHFSLPFAFQTPDGVFSIGFAPKVVAAYLASTLDFDVSGFTAEAFGNRALPKEDSGFAARINVEPSWDFSYGWAVGIFIKPSPRFRFSLAYHSPVDLEFDANMNIRFPSFTRALGPTFDAVGITENTTSRATLKTMIPMHIVGGFRIQPWRQFVNEIFAQWSKWSDTNGISTHVVSSPMKRLMTLKKSEPHHQDEFRIGLLQSYQIIRPWTLGYQFMYVNHSIPDSAMTPSDFDFDSYVPFFFTEYEFLNERLTACLGYSHVFNVQRTINSNKGASSTDHSLNWGNPNGTYRSETDQISINLTYRF